MGADQSQPLQLEDIQRFQQLLENNHTGITIFHLGTQPPPGLIPAGTDGAQSRSAVPERVTPDVHELQLAPDVHELTAGEEDYANEDIERSNEMAENIAVTMGGIAPLYIAEDHASDTEPSPLTDAVSTKELKEKKRRGQVLRTDVNHSHEQRFGESKLRAKKRSVAVTDIVSADPVVEFSVRYSAEHAPIEALEGLLTSLAAGRVVSPALTDSVVLRTLLSVAESTPTERDPERASVLLRTATLMVLRGAGVSLGDALDLLKAVASFETSTGQSLELSSMASVLELLGERGSAREAEEVAPSNVFTSNAVEFAARGTMVRSTHRDGVMHTFAVADDLENMIAFGYDDGAVELGSFVDKGPWSQPEPPKGTETVVCGLQWLEDGSLLAVRHYKPPSGTTREVTTTLSASIYSTSGGKLILKETSTNINSNTLFTCRPGQTLRPQFRLRAPVGKSAHVWLDGGGAAPRPQILVVSARSPKPPRDFVWPYILCLKPILFTSHLIVQKYLSQWN